MIFYYIMYIERKCNMKAGYIDLKKYDEEFKNYKYFLVIYPLGMFKFESLKSGNSK